MTKRNEPRDYAAGGGLLNRRVLLGAGMAFSAASATGAAAARLEIPEWSQYPGLPMSEYGQPSPHEGHVKRRVLGLYPEGIGDGAGVSFTPLEELEGTVTPNGLFFERHHSGIPEIDPERHELVVHGMVKQPLVFTVGELLSLPKVSRLAFLECAGNSLFNSLAEPQQRSAGEIHGLIGAAEWTGVLLSDVLDLAGVDPSASWVLAEGADAAKQSRSIPLSKVMGGDAMIALYQNGERLRPEQGYPMRLVLPGWQGSMQTKWLRRVKVTDGPTHTKDETSKYSLLQKDGKAQQFTFEMGVKSVITRPSPGVAPTRPGLYQVSGLAWSGAGRVSRVEVSADGGASWADAMLDGPALPKMLTRFRLPWNWDGAPSVLMSRAVDETGAVQPSRAEWYEPWAPGQLYHQNAIQAWALSVNGEVSNVYV
ncbi:MAG: sulfite dehydrogenase [Alphaproteobacteria bacterium]|nr:sulfite dehydrogenase [Alphaproteobacteria bacterium]